jgi:hypothetical protein
MDAKTIFLELRVNLHYTPSAKKVLAAGWRFRPIERGLKKSAAWKAALQKRDGVLLHED